MAFALAAVVFAPGLALGSFLNVVAARVPLGAVDRQPRLGLHDCGARDRLVRQRPAPLLPRSSAAAAGAAARDRRCVYPGGRARRPRCSSRPALLAFGLTGTSLVAAFFCAALVAISATDLEHRIIPNRIVLPAAVVVLVVDDRARSRARSGRSARSAPRASSSLAALAYPARDGHGRRQARAPARRRARPHGAGRADGRDARCARAVDRPLRPPRQRGAGRWGSRSRRSSRSARSSRSSPATRCSTRT